LIKCSFLSLFFKFIRFFFSGSTSSSAPSAPHVPPPMPPPKLNGLEIFWKIFLCGRNLCQPYTYIMQERKRKGLCMFCDEQFTPGHQLKHRRSEFL
ncbi:unnamed protein product, partial [Brassica oleracea]